MSAFWWDFFFLLILAKLILKQNLKTCLSLQRCIEAIVCVNCMFNVVWNILYIYAFVRCFYQKWLALHSGFATELSPIDLNIVRTVNDKSGSCFRSFWRVIICVWWREGSIEGGRLSQTLTSWPCTYSSWRLALSPWPADHTSGPNWGLISALTFTFMHLTDACVQTDITTWCNFF